MGDTTKTRTRKPKAVEHVEAIQPFSTEDDGEGNPCVVGRGEIRLTTDPLVKRYPDNFRPLRGDRARPAVEAATAAPGEKRGE
jgi:hypothetical protein